VPPVAIAAVLLIVFGAVSYASRVFVLRRRDEQAREELAEQAKNLFISVAATFAFFVGFSITVTWGAVTAAQSAVEQQAAAIKQISWEIDNIPDRAESTALRDALRDYVQTAATQDGALLARGQTANLPSAGALDRFENALHAYTFGPRAPERVVAPLSAGVAALETASATVSAVAVRAIPRPLAALLVVVAVLGCVVVGITTLPYRRPILAFFWCAIPALSITVVLALAYPFALRSGVTLAPLQAVSANLFGS